MTVIPQTKRNCQLRCSVGGRAQERGQDDRPMRELASGRSGHLAGFLNTMCKRDSKETSCAK
jgi:hypothetical protein